MELNTEHFKFTFIEGPVLAKLFCEESYGLPGDSGAVCHFIGQVRSDMINGKKVQAIDYSANIELAHAQMKSIFTALKEEFQLDTVSVIHSLGIVPAGKICLFVCVCGGHRKKTIEALRILVERLKAEVPVWGKELFEEGDHVWKINK